MVCLTDGILRYGMTTISLATTYNSGNDHDDGNDYDTTKFPGVRSDRLLAEECSLRFSRRKNRLRMFSQTSESPIRGFRYTTWSLAHSRRYRAPPRRILQIYLKTSLYVQLYVQKYIDCILILRK